MDKKLKKYTSFFIQSCEILFFQFISVFFQNQKRYKNLWLFCERGYDAQDNAYLFFQYVKENYPGQNVAFLLKENQTLIENINSSNAITFGSRNHKLAFTLCKKSISTHVGFIEPWNLKLYKLLTFRKSQYIFLQHGVTYNDVSKYLKKSVSPIDIFTVTSNFEYKNLINKKYGFTDKEIKETGFARFDRLWNLKEQTKNQILLMPTWDRTIQNQEDFLNSKYFKSTYSILQNPNLITLLDKYDYKLQFILHPEFKKYENLYANLNENIHLIDNAEIKIQDILIDSKLLITDYSSVFFDMAYQFKPTVFYQFSELKNYKNQDFKFENFGNVVYNESDLIKELNDNFEKNFNLDDEKSANIRQFFTHIDAQNCERIYNIITEEN